MDLITTHINADFDGLGSLVAARKLYPDSRLLLPGSQEQAVRDLMALAKDIITVEHEKECRLDDVTRLILVDTRHKRRIGVASKLIDKGLEVHIYDHHPSMKGDIIADRDVSEEVGATVTILADIIKRRRLRLSPLEATIMLLGIYEETGSLTYRTTTKLDVDMVSFLLSQGASLSLVSSYLNREMSEAELSLLTRLMSATNKVFVNGISVAIIELESEEYLGELGGVIHKLMDIENLALLFVILDTKRGKIDIIARSRLASVDVNKMMSHFGGGGHSSAASAKVKDGDSGSVKNKLIRVLRSAIKTGGCAKDIMRTNVKAFNVDDKISAVKDFLGAARLSGAPVAGPLGLAGIIDMESVDKAINRGFGHSRVKGYMSSKIFSVKPDTPVRTIERMMLENSVGIVPVMRGERMIGVINRTDVLRNVHEELFSKPKLPEKRVVSNLFKKMAAILPKDAVALLKKIGSKSNEAGFKAFVVGGLVRDTMLAVKNLDLDIVIEGNAIKIGHILAKEIGASLVAHKRFGTCSLFVPSGLKIDMATARKEVYEKPAALPTVEFSSLKDDLIRRDFTINAMALSLNKGSFGQLIDFFEGEKDLAQGRIRIMHEKSFIDDPTRIFRAVRFEQRFGFTIEPETARLIKTAIEEEMFDKVEPQRIRDEIILILKEEEPLKAIRRMAQLDELRFLHPKIKFNNRLVKLYDGIGKVSAWYDSSKFKKRAIDRWLIYLMALFSDLSYNETISICSKFVFRRGEVLRILSYKECAKTVSKVLCSRSSTPPSKIYSTLEGLAFEVILLIMAGTESRAAHARMADFFGKYNGMKTAIRGDDLKDIGLRPCPDFKKILKKVLFEKLDGRLPTKADEIAYAKKIVRSLCG